MTTPRSIPELAAELDAHYTRVAEGALPPPPRYRARRSTARPTALGWTVALVVLVASLAGATMLGTQLPHRRARVAEAALDLGQLPPPVTPTAGEELQSTSAQLSVSVCPEGASGSQLMPAGCRVRFASATTPAMVVTTVRDTALQVDADRVVVEHGWAVFDVEHRDASPLRVGFDGGTIAVLGTVFSVFQDDARGHVELVEGKVRIYESGGARHLLEPGARFAWTRGEPANPAPPRVLLKPAAVDDSLDEVARLRSKREYRRARVLVQTLRARASTAREREVLDYELGTLLEAEHAPQADRCAHWQRFLDAYPSSRYAEAIRKRTVDCGP